MTFGVVSHEWTCLPPLLDEVECNGQSRPVELEQVSSLRVAAVAVFSVPTHRSGNVPCCEDEFVEIGSSVANVAGSCAQQIVPRAEAVALQVALEATLSTLSMLSTHGAYVLLNCKNADVRGRIQIRRSQDEHVLFGKIKSHFNRINPTYEADSHTVERQTLHEAEVQ